jgi:choline-sulfatase
MKRLNSIALCAALTIVPAAVSEAAKPNILFIFADDQCHDTVKALGNDEVITPNIDRLVNRGMTFTHTYNMGSWSGAVCVASRAMLNTGKFVWRANAAVKSLEKSGQLWSQRMKKAGYHTYMTGKWHVSASAGKIFDSTGSVRGGMPKQTPQGYNRPKGPDDKTWLPWDTKRGGHWAGGKHWSEVVGDQTVAELKRAAKDDKPFFVYAAFNAPHDPRQSPKEFVDMYPLDKVAVPASFLEMYPYKDAMGCSKGLRDEKLAPFPRTEYAVKVNRQEYYAIITHMDAQIGRILDALEESGQADNTYIFFTADHGLACGNHGLMGKQNMYDHSVRAPLIVCGPGVKANARNSARVYLQDIMPTSLELAGAGTDGVDFKSLNPLIKGERTTQYESIYGAYLNLQRMITKDDFKLIHYPKANVYRLYDLTRDPLEMNDMGKDSGHAQKLEELKKALADVQKEMDDPLVNGASSGGGKRGRRRKK